VSRHACAYAICDMCAPGREQENAEARARIATLEAALRRAVEWVDRLMPGPSHEGACGPDMGCDGQCMDAAAAASDIQELRAWLAERDGL